MSATRPFFGPRMLMLGFIAFNIGLPLNYGIYGTLVQPMQEVFGTTRALAGSGLALMTVVMGLCSPLAGHLLLRYPIRVSLVSGALLGAAGFILLVAAKSIWMLIAIYALIVGPAVCLTGVVPTTTLVSNWYYTGRGRGLGIVTTPLLILVAPQVSAWLLLNGGLSAVFAAMAATYLLIIPVLLLVVTRPADIGQTQRGELLRRAAESASAQSDVLATSRILRIPQIWIVTLAGGVLTAGGIMILTHFVPLAMGAGFTLRESVTLVSIYGISSAAGPFVSGWITDRFGPNASFLINASIQLIPWFLLYFGFLDYPALIVSAALLGLLSGCVTVLHSAAIGRIVNQASFSRAMGISYFIKMPFFLVPAPLAGLVFDQTGTYSIALLVQACLVALVAALFLVDLLRPASTPKDLAGTMVS